MELIITFYKMEINSKYVSKVWINDSFLFGKSHQKFAALFLVVIFIMFTNSIHAKILDKGKKIKTITSPISEKNFTTTTIFGGVGRKFQMWQFGVDLLILSYPF